MVDAGILDHDLVIVRRQQTATSGDIVAATVDGETTLKRFVKQEGRILLVAENPRYSPIEVTTESAVVHGVVVGLLRTYRSPEAEHSRELTRSPEEAQDAHGT